MPKKTELKEAVAGGGTQRVVRVPNLRAITFDEVQAKPLNEKLDTLALLLRENEEKRDSLFDCFRAYNATLDNISNLREEINGTLIETGQTTYKNDTAVLNLVEVDGKDPRISPGVKQVLEFIEAQLAQTDKTKKEAFVEKYGKDFLTKYTNLLIDFRTGASNAIVAANKKANAARNPKDIDNASPPPSIALDVQYVKPITANVHQAALTIEIPRLTGIRGVAFYSYEALKAIEGHEIRCEYEKVTDTPHDDNSRVRAGKSYGEMHGMVKNRFGVQWTLKGDIALYLENNYNRLVDGGDHETDISELRMGVTDKEQKVAKGLGELVDGEYRPTTLSIYGIKPGSLYHKPRGTKEWLLVPTIR